MWFVVELILERFVDKNINGMESERQNKVCIVSI